MWSTWVLWHWRQTCSCCCVFHPVQNCVCDSGGCEIVNTVTGRGEPRTQWMYVFWKLNSQVELLSLKTLQEKTHPENETPPIIKWSLPLCGNSLLGAEAFLGCKVICAQDNRLVFSPPSKILKHHWLGAFWSSHRAIGETKGGHPELAAPWNSFPVGSPSGGFEV